MTKPLTPPLEKQNRRFKRMGQKHLRVLYAFAQKNSPTAINKAYQDDIKDPNSTKNSQEIVNVLFCGLGMMALSKLRKTTEKELWPRYQSMLIESPAIMTLAMQFNAYCGDPKLCRKVQDAAAGKPITK